MAGRVYSALAQASLVAGGAGWSRQFVEGERCAVMGEPGGGALELLAVAAGEEEPAEGAAILSTTAIWSGLAKGDGRKTPLALAQAHAGSRNVEPQVASLTSLGLYELRDQPLHALEPEQQSAAALISVLASASEFALIDYDLDSLDPWTLESVLGLMSIQAAEGRAFLIATNLAAVAERMDSLILMRGGEPVFDGTSDELIEAAGSDEIIVETDDGSTVRQIAEQFALRIEEGDGWVRLEADGGLDRAARLLLEGYGSIRAVTVRRPRLRDALLNLYPTMRR